MLALSIPLFFLGAVHSLLFGLLAWNRARTAFHLKRERYLAANVKLPGLGLDRG